MNHEVDEFISKAKNWYNEIEKLKDIVLECKLQEVFKWHQSYYIF